MAMNKVAYESEMMIPLAYFHLINALAMATVVIFSYAAAVAEGTDWQIFIFVWLSVTVGILGMREVAIHLAEPFGDDDSDLPVVRYVEGTLRFLVSFLKTATTRPRGQQSFESAGLWQKEMAKGTKRQVQAMQTARERSLSQEVTLGIDSFRRVGSILADSADDSDVGSPTAPTSPSRLAPTTMQAIAE